MHDVENLLKVPLNDLPESWTRHKVKQDDPCCNIRCGVVAFVGAANTEQLINLSEREGANVKEPFAGGFIFRRGEGEEWPSLTFPDGATVGLFQQELLS